MGLPIGIEMASKWKRPMRIRILIATLFALVIAALLVWVQPFDFGVQHAPPHQVESQSEPPIARWVKKSWPASEPTAQTPASLCGLGATPMGCSLPQLVCLWAEPTYPRISLGGSILSSGSAYHYYEID